VLLLVVFLGLGRARAARDGGLGPWSLRFRSHAGVVGVLFLRTYDRAERIYWAMAARGFDGRLPAPPTERMSVKDAVFLCGVAALAAAVLTLDRLAYG
jgi:cobalt/nickel transport system permease protein